MRFTLDTPASLSITACSREGVTVGRTLYRTSILILPDAVQEWDCFDIHALDATQLDPLLQTEPELVLLGTGATLRFPDSTLTRGLGQRGIGVEVMDTPAACRTYNILLQEGRRVVAALIVA